MSNTRSKQSRRASPNSGHVNQALKNTLELLGGEEQKENVFRFLQTECGISPDGEELDEKKIAAAFANLFGRGGELLMRRLREESAGGRAQKQESGPADRPKNLETFQ
jgi:hypothetical protein